MYIGIYRFSGMPHILPFIMPNRLEALEIVWQMFEPSTPFKTSQKGYFLPLYLEIGDFAINSNKGFEKAIQMLKSLHLPVWLMGRQLDPERLILL